MCPFISCYLGTSLQELLFCLDIDAVIVHKRVKNAATMKVPEEIA